MGFTNGCQRNGLIWEVGNCCCWEAVNGATLPCPSFTSHMSSAIKTIGTQLDGIRGRDRLNAGLVWVPGGRGEDIQMRPEARATRMGRGRQTGDTAALRDAQAQQTDTLLLGFNI